jgi:hypothetical protein
MVKDGKTLELIDTNDELELAQDDKLSEKKGSISSAPATTSINHKFGGHDSEDDLYLEQEDKIRHDTDGRFKDDEEDYYIEGEEEEGEEELEGEEEEGEGEEDEFEEDEAEMEKRWIMV